MSRKVYILHYEGRGTPEANEVEGVFETEEALIKFVIDETSEYNTEEEVREMLKRRSPFYMKSYEVIQ